MIPKATIISSNSQNIFLIKCLNLVFLEGLLAIEVYIELISTEKYSLILYSSTFSSRIYLISVISKLVLLRIIIRDKL